MNLRNLFRRKRPKPEPKPLVKVTIRADKVRLGDHILSAHYEDPAAPSGTIVEATNLGGPERGHSPTVYLSVPGRHAWYVTQLHPDEPVTVERRIRRRSR